VSQRPVVRSPKTYRIFPLGVELAKVPGVIQASKLVRVGSAWPTWGTAAIGSCRYRGLLLSHTAGA
jgi:hypothetical protein